jgi:osmotically-inducible protein OsmY
MRSDSDIKRDVEDELRWDPNVDSTDIAVTVKNGVVTLTGFVRSFAHKRAAENAAKRVAGVVGLANDLEVRLPGADERPDPEIARDVVAQLKTWLPDSWQHVKPVVKNGRVTLEGEVEWNYQRDYAERALRWIKGVKGVSNLIRLRPQVTPLEIKYRIEKAFRRSALIDANRVTVEASGGEVVLKGTVRSWAERQEAERAAWAAPGVIRVDNRITVNL